MTIPKDPRPNSTPSLSVSLEIFQSFISRSFIFDGDPPPPLGRFTIVRGVVGRARGLRPRDGGPAFPRRGARGAFLGGASAGRRVVLGAARARGGGVGVDVFDAASGISRTAV